jgi:hypothetical protein
VIPLRSQPRCAPTCTPACHLLRMFVPPAVCDAMPLPAMHAYGSGEPVRWPHGLWLRGGVRSRPPKKFCAKRMGTATTAAGFVSAGLARSLLTILLRTCSVFPDLISAGLAQRLLREMSMLVDACRRCRLCPLCPVGSSCSPYRCNPYNSNKTASMTGSM